MLDPGPLSEFDESKSALFLIFALFQYIQNYIANIQAELVQPSLTPGTLWAIQIGV